MKIAEIELNKQKGVKITGGSSSIKFEENE